MVVKGVFGSVSEAEQLREHNWEEVMYSVTQLVFPNSQILEAEPFSLLGLQLICINSKAPLILT